MRHIKYEGYILPVLIVILAFLSGLRFGQIRGRRATTSQIEQMVSELSTPTNKLSYTLSLIDTQYVDSLSLDSIVEHMMPVVMEELDPHSVYIPASEMQQVNEPLEGEFDGIGVVFNMATDTVIVLNVIPSGPSDKAGTKSYTACADAAVQRSSSRSNVRVSPTLWT